jgi:hypothetical protein
MNAHICYQKLNTRVWFCMSDQIKLIWRLQIITRESHTDGESYGAAFPYNVQLCRVQYFSTHALISFSLFPLATWFRIALEDAIKSEQLRQNTIHGCMMWMACRYLVGFVLLRRSYVTCTVQWGRPKYWVTCTGQYMHYVHSAHISRGLLSLRMEQNSVIFFSIPLGDGWTWYVTWNFGANICDTSPCLWRMLGLLLEEEGRYSGKRSA